ncbi:MAG: 3-dehydroquinate dehydratase [Muribaculaceae bacterium]|nr:3-dehydroquinate dehydratase [Bacteroidales bacterium]MBD5341442.1 3-dehydroquinate dehydratase [Bacteroides sp.]MDE6070923.1 3-dehydroquinate dehydratase [Muribaculaceae bacterium]
MKIAIINGPNLNKLGSRDPSIYGFETLEEITARLQKEFPEHQFFFYHSNIEGEIIDFIQGINALDDMLGIVINPGAYSHYSYAIADAMADSHLPIVEVHISNIHAREEFRRTSVTGAQATAVISGCGCKGYNLAVQYLIYLKS